MILYNVTVKVEKEIAEEWLRWMQETHVPAVMATGRFTEYKLCRILHEEEDGLTFAVQYFSPDMATFHQFYLEDSPRLQKAHKDRFGERYVTIRTLMEVLEEKRVNG